MRNQLNVLMEKGSLRPLDFQFAKFIAEMEQQTELKDLMMLLAATTSYQLGKGHVCVYLDKIESSELFILLNHISSHHVSSQELEKLPNKADWSALLKQASSVSDGTKATPLVFDGTRLYLQRYWAFEQRVSNYITQATTPISMNPQLSDTLNTLFFRQYNFLWRALNQRNNSNQIIRQQLVCDVFDVVDVDALDWQAIDAVLVSATQLLDLEPLDQLIPNQYCLNWQKVAAAMALTRQFSVISGGPGTGKTTTVIKLLAALVVQAQQPITIKLVAPTGKAAARLSGSIGNAVKSLALSSDIKEAIPTEASTLHRLLGYIPNQVDFRHHKANPLHLDVLVLDEASMVDLPMMARLLDAMPPNARLILLGDKDQLSSVEAGAVLGDICQFAPLGYSQKQAQQLSLLTGFTLPEHSHHNAIADSLCMLQKSYRFDARSGIGQLAKAINSGDHTRVTGLCGEKEGEPFSDIHFHPLHPHAMSQTYDALIKLVVERYRHYLESIHQNQSPEKVLKGFAQTQLLCAMREGHFGVEGLNQQIEKTLRKAKLIPPTDEAWYLGRPVMITQNDYGIELYNGDVGITMLDGKEQRLRVYFEMPDGTMRGILPSQLPEHETVYAMTIHKSQGSEFEQVILALPTEFSPILTRELLYTGVTRAKNQLHLFAVETVVSKAIMTKTQRNSGLFQ